VYPVKNSKTNISDIAKALNISAMSVSRALSGSTGISEALRSKITEKAKELGYTKHITNTVANILILHQKPFTHDNSNFSSMVQGIEKAIQNTRVEYSIEFVDKINQDNMYLPIKLTKGNNFDAVLFIGKFNDEYAKYIKQKIKNQVFYAGYSPSYDYDCVWFNFNNGGYKQCEYLIKKGHKNIGFLGNTDIFRNRERLLGITSALEDYKIPIHEEFYINSDIDFEKNILELMNKREKPTAIICQLDSTAIRLMNFLHENQISVPKDLSVIGSGNTEMSTLSFPTLTTLDLNILYSCEAVVALLLKRIAYPDKPNENITINSTLVERASVRNI
jgi:LacI family transcriptional regulator